LFIYCAGGGGEREGRWWIRESSVRVRRHHSRRRQPRLIRFGIWSSAYAPLRNDRAQGETTYFNAVSCFKLSCHELNKCHSILVDEELHLTRDRFLLSFLFLFWFLLPLLLCCCCWGVCGCRWLSNCASVAISYCLFLLSFAVDSSIGNCQLEWELDWQVGWEIERTREIEVRDWRRVLGVAGSWLCTNDKVTRILYFWFCCCFLLAHCKHGQIILCATDDAVDRYRVNWSDDLSVPLFVSCKIKSNAKIKWPGLFVFLLWLNNVIAIADSLFFV